MVRLAVHVTPKAGKDEVTGWRGDALQVRVTAAPEGGKANAAVCRVIASALGVPKTRVRVVRGDTSRHKSVEVDGIDAEKLAEALGAPPPSLF